MEILSLKFILITIVLFFLSETNVAPDTISFNISEGKTLVPKHETFELGFFNPGRSRNRYVGIWWCKNIPARTVVWVANRQNPISDTSGLLIINRTGHLVLLSQRINVVVWSAK